MKTPVLFLLCFITLAFAQAADTTEGGNVTEADASSGQNATWHGVCGTVSSDAFVPVVINATPGGITCLTINTGSSACKVGTGYVNLLFSNSSDSIITLSRGNLTLLDQFINRPAESASSTFSFSTAFPTRGWGTITGVPTTYTNSPVPATFRMGYLNDQSRNIVIITRISQGSAGFNGSIFDFQLMLPTRNGTATLYYVTADYKCNAPPGGGGGTHTPFNQTSVSPAIPPVSPPELPGELGKGNCTYAELFCGEWSGCVDGYRQQSCPDVTNCTDIEVYRIEPCAVPPNVTVWPSGYKIPKYFVENPPWFIMLSPEYLCSLFAIIVLILFLIIRKLRQRKKSKVAI